MRVLVLTVFMALPRIVYAEDTLYRISMITAIAAHGADLGTTEYCLGAGKCRELNPFFGHFTTQPATFGAIKMGIAGVSLWVTSKIPNKRAAMWVNFAVTGFFTGVAYRNVLELRKVGL